MPIHDHDLIHFDLHPTGSSHSVPATRSILEGEVDKQNDEYNQTWPPQGEADINLGHRDLQSGKPGFSDAICAKIYLGMVAPR